MVRNASTYRTHNPTLGVSVTNADGNTRVVAKSIRLATYTELISSDIMVAGCGRPLCFIYWSVCFLSLFHTLLSLLSLSWSCSLYSSLLSSLSYPLFYFLSSFFFSLHLPTSLSLLITLFLFLLSFPPFPSLVLSSYLLSSHLLLSSPLSSSPPSPILCLFSSSIPPSFPPSPILTPCVRPLYSGDSPKHVSV